MQIILRENGKKRLRLRLPNALLFNGLSALFLSKRLKKEGVSLSYKQLRILFREAKKYASTHPGWKLIEVQGNDEQGAEITIFVS
ncbi:MAG: hypothetical protein IJX59_03240 [Clostridia bacterium]|nr:hypothetical protein [Clostridia bacterium]